jgi:hypothetical protein
MANCSGIFSLATGIWQQINEPTDLSVSAIEGKLLSSGFLGSFDILVNGCHYIDYDSVNSGYCIAPALNSEEYAIYEKLYTSTYFQKQSIKVLNMNAGVNSALWTRLQENDSVISRSDPISLAKYLKDMYTEHNESMKDLVFFYKQNKSTARSVDYPPAC